MKRKIILSLLVLISTTALFSQIFEPIKWSFELKNTGKTTADIILKATIDEGWHLYGMNIPEGGPRPTSFVFEGVQNAKLEGKVQSQSKLKEVYDPNFDMKLNWYANQAVFVQKISFTDAAKVRVTGYVEFMACDDQSCLPPAQESFDLGSKNVKAAETASNATSELQTIETLAVTDSAASETPQETKTTEVADYWTPVIDQLNAFGNMLGDADTVSYGLS